MGIFSKNKVASHNPIGQGVLDSLKGQDLICAVLNSVCIVDLGNLSIQTENFPNCEKCLENFGTNESINCIPDCSACGRNEESAINIRSGVGDGVYPILGLCNTNWVGMGEIPPFKGFVVDFRQDMPNFYLEKAITNKGFADINLALEDILNGVDIVNYGAISSNGRLFLTDILSTTSPGPVVCDLVCEPGEYDLFVILDHMHDPSNPMPKVLIGIKSDFSAGLKAAYPYMRESRDLRIKKWNEASNFFLTGDHKSQCYMLNYWIAENSARHKEAASWLVLGAEAGDQSSIQRLEEGINFEIFEGNYKQTLSLRLP